jgi:hypothetical protein
LFYGAGGLALILPLAAVGWPRSRGPRVVEQLIGAELVGCALATYVAPSLATRFALLQPYRLLIPLCFFACVPAGRGAAHAARLAVRRPILASALAVVSAIVVGNAVWGRMPLLVLGYGDDAAETHLEGFVERSTSVDDRILVESPTTRLPIEGAFGRVIVVRRFALLPLFVDREFLGYTGNAPFMAHRYAGFDGGVLFGKSLAGLSDAQFSAMLSRYAISWVVACSGDALAGVRRFAAVVDEVEAAADCRIFRVRDPQRSRFVEGGGEARASLDRIDVRHAAGDRVVLKYHWMPGLRTEPPLPVEESRQPGAAVGFIAIRPGSTADFTIRPATIVERATSLLGR